MANLGKCTLQPWETHEKTAKITWQTFLKGEVFSQWHIAMNLVVNKKQQGCL